MPMPSILAAWLVEKLIWPSLPDKFIMCQVLSAIYLLSQQEQAGATLIEMPTTSAAEKMPIIVGTSLDAFVPSELRELGDLQTALPRIAKDPGSTGLIDSVVPHIPTAHHLHLGDVRRQAAKIRPESVHLVVTSPPYWTLKEYRRSPGQLGFVEDYEQFIGELDKVWRCCFRALVPGGRLVIVVGDVCLSRRKNGGRHTVVPLHSSIQERCRALGFDNLAPIIWHKITNAAYEVENGSRFLGKPYEPNAVVKNDIEYILMQRKPGAYRKPTPSARVLSVISAANHQSWFQQIWSDVTGASTKDHPAPYPLELAERLVRMFSFVGDTVLDPFLGTGTTCLAAAKWGRNSIGIEVDRHYFDMSVERLANGTDSLFGAAQISTYMHESSSKRTPV
jgi:modification methylase